MEDEQLQASKAQTTPRQDLGRIGQLLVRRTPEWLKATAGKLSVLLKKIISCTSAHQHWRVRLEMVELSDHLLARCSQSLGECVGLLLEALVGAVNDEEPQVRQRCGAVLRMTQVSGNKVPLYFNFQIFFIRTHLARCLQRPAKTLYYFPAKCCCKTRLP